MKEPTEQERIDYANRQAQEMAKEVVLLRAEQKLASRDAEVAELKRQLSDLTSSEYLETTYYVKQRKDMESWMLGLANLTFEQRITQLSRMLIDWSCTYVHGANLNAVMLQNKELQKQLEEANKTADNNNRMWEGQINRT